MDKLMLDYYTYCNTTAPTLQVPYTATQHASGTMRWGHDCYAVTLKVHHYHYYADRVAAWTLQTTVLYYYDYDYELFGKCTGE